MATTEPTINDVLANVVRQTRNAWRSGNVVKSENSGQIKGSNERPDILVDEPNTSPVVIETEVLPASNVEKEARERLGKQISTSGKTILSSIAVRMPKSLRSQQGDTLRKAISDSVQFEMALYSGHSKDSYIRWPSSGWLKGDVKELSILIQHATLPPEIVERASDILVSGVKEGAGLLAEIAGTNPGALQKIGLELKQEDSEQTRRMAATILANAFVFHEILAGGSAELSQVKSVEELRSDVKGLRKSTVLAQWRQILDVNYWPIFDIARRILQATPTIVAPQLLNNLADVAEQLLDNQVMKSHDLTGAVFQKLITDRKFLAAYYTTPASAALLLGLTLSFEQTPSFGVWNDMEGVKKLRIADFACGTGTLLSTAYQRIRQAIELAHGNAELLHDHMMADVLVGCDVLPAAAHLTASMLSGAHPNVTYRRSSVLTVAYGKQEDDSIALGSLDLLDPQGKLGFLSITAKALEGKGDSDREIWHDLPHKSFDLIIMNPPFTRPTGHEGKKIGVPNPMFAAFRSDEEEQRKMGEATKQLTQGTGVGGNAGEASIFLLLADRKLKTDGTLGLILPLSLMAGGSRGWQSCRTLLADRYRDLIIVTIAGRENNPISFSADTGMGECMIVGTKSADNRVNNGGDKQEKRATFVVLDKSPQQTLESTVTSTQIRELLQARAIRKLEDGPVGGTDILFGDDMVGQIIDAPLSNSGIWNLARIADFSLVQCAFQLKNNRLWLPGMMAEDTVEIPIILVEKVGEVGPLHQDIQHSKATGTRGPFDIVKLRAGRVPTYPVLWSHHAPRERTLAFDGDMEAVPHKAADPQHQPALDAKRAAIVQTASHCHFNQNFRYNSQSTAMQFTTRKTLGGRAWMSIQLEAVEQAKAVVLWANTSLGILLHWWHANRQQPGRGNISKTALKSLPVLDVTALSPEQLTAASQLFDAICDKELLPIHQIDQDEVRKELDEKFAQQILGVPQNVVTSLTLLRQKISQEPSIRGTK